MSAEPVIILYNNLTFSLTMVILLSTVTDHAKLRRYIAAFILISAAGIVLTFDQRWIMVVNIILLTACFGGRKRYSRTFLRCLTVTTLTWSVVATISSALMLAAPGWLYSNSYNLFMGGVLIAAACAIRIKPDIMNWCRRLRQEGYVIALELLILVFFSFVMPELYPIIPADKAGRFGMIMLCFMLVLAISGLLVNRISNLEHKRQMLASQIEQQGAYAGQIEAQFYRMVAIKHFYTKLYQSLAPLIRDNDMDGLRDYFEKHIAPIHREQIQNGGQLEYIQNELLRNLMDITIGQAATMAGITLDVDITGNINLPDSMALDVFEIMSNLIDNSLEALKEQTTGLLRIGLHQSDKHLSIQIANTLDGDLMIETLYNHDKKGKDVHGYGLKRVRDIVYRYSDMRHFTFKEGEFEGKIILIQQIEITLEGD